MDKQEKKVSKILKRRCPVCAGKEFELLYTHVLQLPEMLSFMPSSLDIVCCKDCGMVYTASEATQGTYNRYYDTVHAYTEDKNTHNEKEDIYTRELREKEFNILKRFIDKNDCIIDVGSGTGGSLQTFKSHGFHHLLGIDIDDKKEMMASKGIDFVQGDIASLPFLELEQFFGMRNMFMLNGVLEHIFDVKTAINSLFETMNNNDLLYVMVPDADEYLSHFDRPFRYFGMEHINHFNEKTLKILFEHCGFVVVAHGKFEYNLNKYNLDPAIYILAQKKKLERDTDGRNNVIAYLEKSKKTDREIKDKIAYLAESKKEIIVWGVGSYFMALCDRTQLLECKIKFLADNNKSLWNTSLKGKLIRKPQDIKKYSECCICVVSGAYADNILQEIQSMRLTNEVVIL